MRPRTVVLAVSLFASLMCNPAIAVRVAQHQAGEVAVIPLYNTLAGNDSLFRISNGEIPSAVRVQLRGHDGRRAEAFNVYLPPHDSFGFALTMGTGSPRFVKGNNQCVLVTDGAMEVVQVESDFPIEAPYGYIEILHMGHISDEQTGVDILLRDCDSLAERFTSGPWGSDSNAGVSAPSEALQVVAQMINVERGTLYGLEPVYLTEFRTLPYHVPPLEPFGLADVLDEGTSEGETSSLVCNETCERERWEDPRDAVASVFLATARKGDFVVNPEIGASTSFVVLNPMQPYYEDGEFLEHDTGLYISVAGSGVVPTVCLPLLIRPSDICPRPVLLDPPEALSVFSMAESDFDEIPSRTDAVPLLGLPGLLAVPQSIPSSFFLKEPFEAGAATIVFLSFNQPSLTSNDQSEFLGLPSVVLGFTEYINGQVASITGDTVRANYGASALAPKALTHPGDQQ